MTEIYKFESPEAMYAELKYADLYSPSLEYYAFLYNEAGAVCHYELDMEEAKELAERSAEDGEYWGAFLGVGGHIWDSPDDEYNKPNEGCSSMDFCEAYYRNDWIDTRDFLTYYDEMKKLSPCIAIDFDGTLCENKYPEIGEPNYTNIGMAKLAQSHGGKLILWTCRSGEDLDKALEFCKRFDLTFDAVNENPPEMIALFDNDPRKVGATSYWDDKGFDPSFLVRLIDALNGAIKSEDDKIRDIVAEVVEAIKDKLSRGTGIIYCGASYEEEL